MQRVVGFVVVVIIVIAVRFFTVDQNEVLKFNDGTVAILEKHGDPFVALIESTSPYFAGETANISQLRTQLAAARADAAQLMDEVNKISVPDDDLCKSFHATVVAFAANSDKVCTDFEAMIARMEANNPGEDSDWLEVANMLQNIATSVEAASSNLEVSQQTMAKKYKITLQY